MEINVRSADHQPVQAGYPAAPAHSPARPDKRGSGAARFKKQWSLWLVVLILFIAAAGTAAYYIKRYHDSQQQVQKLSNPDTVAQLQNQQLISKVGSLTVLPSSETPTIATVTDITKLQGQQFFANAQNGDKVLIYTQAKKAYLYRPSANKIINIAPVNLGSGTSSTSGTTSTKNSSTSTKTSQ
jgi:hypothetical protein